MQYTKKISRLLPNTVICIYFFLISIGNSKYICILRVCPFIEFNYRPVITDSCVPYFTCLPNIYEIKMDHA